MARADDATLVERARAGDRSAFAGLVDRHHAMVLGLCRRAAGPVLAEDAVQEAVLTAMLRLDRLRRPERFGAWLAGIGLNFCRLWLRQRARSPDSWEACADRPEPPDAALDPAEQAVVADVAARVRAAVAALPRGQRSAVLLHYLAGLSQAEAAATLGVEPGAVKARLHKARQALRAPLRDLWSEEASVTVESNGQRRDASLVEVVVEQVRVNVQSGQRVIFLAEREGERVLPIWVGQQDADALVVHLEKVEVARPMTHDFALSMLRASGTRVSSVTVDRVTDDIFYATVGLEGPGGPVAVDARPSDAINVAARAGAPILVDPALFPTGLTRAQVVEGDDASQRAQLALLGEMSAALAAAGARWWLHGSRAIDVLVGAVTRRHFGIEAVARQRDRAAVRRALTAAGFAIERESDHQLAFRKSGQSVRLLFVDRRRDGRIATHGAVRPLWRDDALPDRVHRLESIECRVVDARQLLDELETDRTFGGPRDAAGVRQLRELLGRGDAPPGPASSPWAGWLPRGSGAELTPELTRVLELARDEDAAELGHNYVGTEHLLLALLRPETGTVARLLADVGTDPAAVRATVERILGRGSTAPVGQRGPAPRVKTVLRLAVDDAARRGHARVGPAHLLLALFDEGEGVAVGVLRHLGLDLAQLRDAAAGVLARSGNG